MVVAYRKKNCFSKRYYCLYSCTVKIQKNLNELSLRSTLLWDIAQWTVDVNVLRLSNTSKLCSL